jgi:hypothetical protein
MSDEAKTRDMSPEEIAKIDKAISENWLRKLQLVYRKEYEARWGKGSYPKSSARSKAQ